MSFDGDEPQKWLRIQGSAYYVPQTTVCWLTVFKIVLLEHIHTYLFIYCLWLLPCYNDKVDRDCMALNFLLIGSLKKKMFTRKP